jgi:hypothetical protein
MLLPCIPRPRLGALQVDVQLAVGELAPEPMGDVHGQGRLADPGLAGHRRDDDRVRWFLGAVAGQQPEDAGDLLLAAGEVDDRRGQQARHRRLRGHVRRDPAGGRLELVAVGTGQLQGVSQPPDGVRIGPADPAPFQVAQGPLAQPRPLGQLLLGEPQSATVPPYQPTQRELPSGRVGCVNLLMHVPSGGSHGRCCALCPCRPGQ